MSPLHVLLNKALETGLLVFKHVPALSGGETLVPAQYVLYVRVLGGYVRVLSINADAVALHAVN